MSDDRGDGTGSNDSHSDRPPPQRLAFDDGSRVVAAMAVLAVAGGPKKKESAAPSGNSNNSNGNNNEEKERKKKSPRRTSVAGGATVREYYELDRIAGEIRNLAAEVFERRGRNRRGSEGKEMSSMSTSSSTFRVALQFPDELLSDAPAACWALEEALLEEEDDATTTTTTKYDVFVLGDTTFAGCCPDSVAAAHLNADCLVHYGRDACLSPCTELPVLYSFGGNVVDRENSAAVATACADAVLKEEQRQKRLRDGANFLTTTRRRILLLYEVRYHSSIEELRTQLRERGDLLVAAGRIPFSATTAASSPRDDSPSSVPQQSCGCRSAKDGAAANNAKKATTTGDTSNQCCTRQEDTGSSDQQPGCGQADSLPDGPTGDVNDPESFTVGGLELPASAADWSSFTMLYVGDTSSRQYLNIVLRFLSSSPSRVERYWAWDPASNKLQTDLPSPTFQRTLNRRFYLIQKARHASVFGILVANFSDSKIRSVVATLRKLLADHGRDSYTFVVGKINPNKLANFAEVDCFVLVACPEHSLLQDEKEYHVPVLTPLEASMALGIAEWGSREYSLNFRDYLNLAKTKATSAPLDSRSNSQGDLTDDDDAPYFSLVTGKFELAPSKVNQGAKVGSIRADSLAEPGRRQLTTYHSAASDFLKQREYRGLQVLQQQQPGEDDCAETKVQVATQGQHGIASSYGGNR